ncbi:MAG: murein biosynthesis integral membrane protein MurJ, partial [Betaproteobacteria bacterium]|nr:murein biosynthesis integral membrane protein MurJ [Betaproteobacteria bacterium]
LFAEGAFSQAFVPILAHAKTREGEATAHRLVNHVASALTVALICTTALGVIFAPQVAWVSAPGFRADPGKLALTAQLLQITFPYIFFISLVSLAAGILNTWNRFWVPAFTPVLLNLSFIFFALVAAPWFDQPIVALAWGAFAGGLLQLLFQWPFLRAIRMQPRWSWAPRDPGLRRMLKLMGPAVIGVSVGQISLLISTIFASFLPSGSVSWLYYADRLMEFPTGLLGAALGTILLPSLVSHHAAGDEGRYSDLLDWGLRLTLLLTLPAVAALAIAGIPLVSTLFFRGAFQPHDVLMVRNALLAYSVGLLGLIAVKILAPGFYARQDVKTPVKIAILVLGATQVMNLAFMALFQHAGLALATGLGACLNAGLLYHGLRKRSLYHPRAGWRLFLLKLGIAVSVMGALLYGLQGDSSRWLSGSSLDHVLQLAPLLGASVAAYFGTLYLLGFRPRDFSRNGA